MTDAIHQITEYLISLPPWLDRVGSILGILTFVGGLSVMFMKWGRRALDILASLNRRSAIRRAEALSDSLKNYLTAWDTPSAMIVLICSEAIKAVATSMLIPSTIFLTLYGAFLNVHQIFISKYITSNITLTTLRNKVVEGTFVTSIFIILVISIFGLSLLIGAQRLARMQNRPRHAQHEFARIKEFLYKLGLSEEDTFLWLAERGLSETAPYLIPTKSNP